LTMTRCRQPAWCLSSFFFFLCPSRTTTTHNIFWVFSFLFLVSNRITAGPSRLRMAEHAGRRPVMYYLIDIISIPNIYINI
jgi:hypothetical protein